MYTQSTKTPISTLAGKLQIFELKQIADMEAVYKTRAQEALTAYKNWKNSYAAETDIISLLYGQMEGQSLRLQAQNAVTVYWTIRQDFKILFANYLDKSCSERAYKSRLAA